MKLLVLIFVFAVAVGCSDSATPTRPAECKTSVVFAQESYYSERAEPEREFDGRLEWRNTPATPNGRDHRYFLDGTAVYSGGTFTEPVFKEAAGSRVTIRGKLVDVGFGPEIWAAALTSCR